ncbi:unnamed protein product, partial [marine sediment metagenome]
VVQWKSTDVTDSTTEVALDTPLRRVFRVIVLDNTALDQDIWVGPNPSTAANVSAIIQAGMNQTLMAIYTVPADTTAYVTSYYGDYVRDFAKDPDGISFSLWVRDSTGPYAKQIKHQKGIPKQAPGFQHEFRPYFKVTEASDIYITGEPVCSNSSITVGSICHLLSPVNKLSVVIFKLVLKGCHFLNNRTDISIKVCVSCRV